MKYKALIVEDEYAIATLIKVNLAQLNIEADIVGDGDEAISLLQSQEKTNYDLFVLDRMLPAVDGIQICKFIRMYKETKDKAILMVTALTKPQDIVDGLEAGADDYLIKPFDIKVLSARVKALLRRLPENINQDVIPENILIHKDLKVDLDQCKVWTNDQEVNLTVSEYKLLCTLLQQPGKVLTRKQLVETIQGGPIHVTERTIDTHIFGLRKKLNSFSNIIETIRGIGYRILND